MLPTPKLRVLFDRIPQVLVCLFLQGVIRKYGGKAHTICIEILTCAAIFYHLEDSRSHGNEREAEQARGQGARPPP